MTSQAQQASVRTQVVVAAPVERAFQVFTEDFDRIKPREHNLLQVPIAETVFERRVGGTIYDRGVDGSVCRWARVLAYEPPHRIVFSWAISPRWQIETDPDTTSEVEVWFISEAPERTRLELEHRNLERHGAVWESERVAINWRASLTRRCRAARPRGGPRRTRPRSHPGRAAEHPARAAGANPAGVRQVAGLPHVYLAPTRGDNWLSVLPL